MSAAGKKFTLVIDAGHGGHDAGAIGAFSKEKDINLRTALAFGRYVECNCPDVKVIYTRKTDVFVTLHGRADIANKAKADLFVSIHTNAAPTRPSSVRGMETYTLGMHRAADNLAVAKRENEVILQEKDYKTRYQGFDPNSSESYIIFEFLQDHNMQKSVDLAKYVQRNVCSMASRPDKGVKQAGFLVLRETSMPSCLIELGFISTPSDEHLLNDASKVDEIARGIYQAFVQYRSKYDADAAVPYKPIETSQTNTVQEKEPLPPAPTSERSEGRKDRREQVPDVPPTMPEPRTTAEIQPQPQPVSTAKPVVRTDDLIFKVQIFAVGEKLRKGDARLKGRSDADYYRENGMVKYTIGSSSDYNEMNRLRRELNATFPNCFVIAFKNGEKMDINKAIREFKTRR